MAIKKCDRLKRRVDFQRVFATKQSQANKCFVLYYATNPDARVRIGITISKKVGNAVERNRIKRLIRHALRDLMRDIAPYDVVIICRKAIAQEDYDGVMRNLKHVLKLSKIYQGDRKNH